MNEINFTDGLKFVSPPKKKGVYDYGERVLEEIFGPFWESFDVREMKNRLEYITNKESDGYDEVKTCKLKLINRIYCGEYEYSPRLRPFLLAFRTIIFFKK